MRGAFILIQMSRAVQNVFLIFIIGKVAQFLLPPPISSLSLGFSFFFYTAMKFSLWSQKRTTLDSNGDLFESCSSNFFFISYVFPPPLLSFAHLNLDFHCAFNKFHTYFFCSRCRRWRKERDFTLSWIITRPAKRACCRRARKCTRHRVHSVDSTHCGIWRALWMHISLNRNVVNCRTIFPPESEVFSAPHSKCRLFMIIQFQEFNFAIELAERALNSRKNIIMLMIMEHFQPAQPSSLW